MAKILVTGATGFLGRSLVDRLVSSSDEVVGVSSRDGDVSASGTWTSFPRADFVIHLAARTFVPDSWLEPNAFIQANLDGTVCALDYCRTHAAKFIYCSAYLYGAPDQLPISESAPLRPNNPYALSKKLAEEACRFYSEFYSVDVTILRPFNVYGPGQGVNWLIPSIIKQVMRGDFVEVKDLTPRRDYVYIDDLVDVFICAMEKPKRFNVLNVGSGESHSVGDIVQMIQRIVGTKLPVRSLDQRRAHEIMDTRADIRKIFSVYGWRPKWSINDGLRQAVASFVTNYKHV